MTIPIKLLCDTPAYDNIEASVLPFMSKSDTGSCFPSVGLNIIQVPMHNVMVYLA